MMDPSKTPIGGYMRQFFVILTLMLLICGLYAIPGVNTATKTPLYLPQAGRIEPVRIPPPAYTFTRTPVTLLTSYYDYMIGSYSGLPLQVIPPVHGGGYLMTYHARRTPTSTRRVFFAHLLSDGTMPYNNEITTISNHEGYPSMVFDPASGKALYAWHCNADADPDLEVQFTSDAYIYGIPGLFSDPQIIANAPVTITAPNGVTTTNNEFIWPTAKIGPSPVAGKKRVYVAMRNSVTHSAAPCDNVYIAFADFDANDIENGIPLQWSHTSIPEQNQWNLDQIWRRPFHNLVADNAGNIYYVGYHTTYENDLATVINEADLDVFKCTNYGQGTWTRLSSYSDIPTWNPPAEPGGSDGHFCNAAGNPYPDAALSWSILNSSHTNAVVDNYGYVRFPGLWGLSTTDNTYYGNLQFVKEMLFDPLTSQFSIRDIYPRKGWNDDYNNCFTPWDREAPWGEVDAYAGDAASGYTPVMFTDWPFPHWDNTAHSDAMMFLYNSIKMTQPNAQGMMACVWQNSQRAKLYNQYSDATQMAYANTPEIYISVSPNNGMYWSEPIVLNNVDTPQLAGIKPMWVYPANEVIYMGHSGNAVLGKLGLMFYNDYTWGSNSITPSYHPTNDGGQVMFMELQISFPNDGGTNVVNTPYFTPPAGTYHNPVEVFISCVTPGAYIRYTLDGSDPTIASLEYTGPFYVNTSSTIKARAYLPGMDPSNIAVINYVIQYQSVSTPTFNPPAGAYPSPISVTISCSTPGVTVHYTLDGSIPDESSPEYNSPIPIAANVTLKARGYRGEMPPSEVATASYEMAAPPTSVQAEFSWTYVQLTWSPPTEPALSGMKEQHRNIRALLGYRVWRLRPETQQLPATWLLLTQTPITATIFTDMGLAGIEQGNYMWAVKAIYTGTVASSAAFSNPLFVTQWGSVHGYVRDAENQAIAGANILCGDFSTTSSENGLYELMLPVGVYSVLADHPAYEATFQPGVLVLENQATLVNFQLNYRMNLQENFETQPSFATEFAPWSMIDVDEAPSLTLPGYSWPQAGTAQAFILFDPSATTPPLTLPEANPYSGSKFAACMAANGVPNNDWMISPRMRSVHTVRFWAKSYSADYAPEKFRIGISSSAANPAAFTIISGTAPVEVPAQWTEYSYSVPPFETLYVGIQCVSEGGRMLMIDDFHILGGVPTQDPTLPAVQLPSLRCYPNPFRDSATIRFSLPKSSEVVMEIFNVKGQMVRRVLEKCVKEQGEHSVIWDGTGKQGTQLPNGVYYIRLKSNAGTYTGKTILLK